MKNQKVLVEIYYHLNTGTIKELRFQLFWQIRKVKEEKLLFKEKIIRKFSLIIAKPTKC